MEHPSFGKRFLAWLLDGLVIGFATAVLLLAFGDTFGLGFDADIDDPFAIFDSFRVVILLLVLQFAYFGYFWSRDGQSVGKRVMGISVVGRDGGLLSFASAGLRGTFGYWVSGSLFYLGYLWALFDEHNETWHDKLFNSVVIIDGV